MGELCIFLDFSPIRLSGNKLRSKTLSGRKNFIMFTG